MSAHHKSNCPGLAGQNANLKTDTASLPTAENLSKQIATLQAKFALLGHALKTTKRADDGRLIYAVTRWGQSRSFAHLHDLQAFLTQIGGAQ